MFFAIIKKGHHEIAQIMNFLDQISAAMADSVTYFYFGPETTWTGLKLN